jgi:hypothetical protein
VTFSLPVVWYFKKPEFESIFPNYDMLSKSIPRKVSLPAFVIHEIGKKYPFTAHYNLIRIMFHIFIVGTMR